MWHVHRRYGAVPAGGGAAPAKDVPEKSDVDRIDGRLPATGLIDQLSCSLASARAAFSNLIELMSLEARRASLSLMWIIIWGGVAAVCIVASWLGLVAALVIWAVSTGFPPIAAAVAVAAINLAAGAVLIHACIGMSRDLIFPATRRQLAGKPPVKLPTT